MIYILLLILVLIFLLAILYHLRNDYYKDTFVNFTKKTNLTNCNKDLIASALNDISSKLENYKKEIYNNNDTEKYNQLYDYYKVNNIVVNTKSESASSIAPLIKPKNDELNIIPRSKNKKNGKKKSTLSQSSDNLIDKTINASTKNASYEELINECANLELGDITQDIGSYVDDKIKLFKKNNRTDAIKSIELIKNKSTYRDIKDHCKKYKNLSEESEELIKNNDTEEMKKFLTKHLFNLKRDTINNEAKNTINNNRNISDNKRKQIIKNRDREISSTKKSINDKINNISSLSLLKKEIEDVIGMYKNKCEILSKSVATKVCMLIAPPNWTNNQTILKQYINQKKEDATQEAKSDPSIADVMK